jgi:DNA-binding transcriptional regulator YiaG
MDYKTFTDKLNTLGLKKTEFMRHVEMNTGTVSTWSKTDKVPKWVELYLDLLIKVKALLPDLN